MTQSHERNARQRPHDRVRPIDIQCGFLERRAGSVLYGSGLTRVLCTASLEEGVPAFLEGKGRGWATSEYDLLPGATTPRKNRERGGKIGGRTQEIQRLIGRSLRAVLDLSAIPDLTLKIDCDVLQADGGTRSASISGAYVAAALAVRDEIRSGRLKRSPLTSQLAAISVGILDGTFLLDLDQAEDSAADVDLNVVMTDEGSFVEVQGTAEGLAFGRDDLNRLLDLAQTGIAEILEAQRKVLEE